DEFHADYLGERTADAGSPETMTYASSQEPKVKTHRATDETRRHPVSAFPAHARQRRQLDAAWTFAALHRSLAGKGDPLPLEHHLIELEDQLEASAPALLDGRDLGERRGVSPPVFDAMQESAQLLAQRLLARAEREEPGHLLLNPCSFPRRVV